MINKEKEVWKTYPKIPFLQASNLGRIRTVDRIITRSDGQKRLVKGRVLKQQLNKSGYMYVQIRVNGKPVDLIVHRVVATCFLPNPNNYPEVNHIDNDRTNNAASNLEWCTRQYNSDYKKNFGTTSTEVLGHPVFAVDLKTGKVYHFYSQHEAAHQLNISVQRINMVIKGKQYQTGGWWFTEDKREITEEKIREIRAKIQSRSVIAVNPETSEVFWFKSQHEAARKLGASEGNVCNVIKGRKNKTHGCWFTYANENAVRETREKFGDEMAEKVEKLMREHQ